MSSNSPAEPRRRKRILCVDDEPSVRDVLKLFLETHGYAVEIATDGRAAFEVLQRDAHRFDLVITDNQMPNLTGLELVEKLRAHGYNGRVLFFSSTLSSQTAARVEKLRVDALVEKGQPMSVLLQAIEGDAGR